MSINWKDDFWTRWRRIDATCMARMEKGSDTYAKTDISTDRAHLMRRKMVSDLIEELYDVINYAKAEIMHLEEIQRDIDYWEIRAKQIQQEAERTEKRAEPAEEWGG